MDIANKGWKCDSCGKEFIEGSCGYEARHFISIESYSSHNTCNCGTYTDICNDCVNAIMEILDPANIE